jgi:phage terminase large subunit-like protein
LTQFLSLVPSGYLAPSSIAHIEKLRNEIWKEVGLKNSFTVYFKSYEQGREKLQGAGKLLICFDEEPRQDFFDDAFVHQEAGQDLDIIMTMTPI